MATDAAGETRDSSAGGEFIAEGSGSLGSGSAGALLLLNETCHVPIDGFYHMQGWSHLLLEAHERSAIAKALFQILLFRFYC